MKFNIKSKKGFTLIELLVVIGILAVLAAIAIPSVAGLIDRANVSADKTNSNEMTNAVERFASEYELYCQDIASGVIKESTTDFDSAQGRVYNVTGVKTRAGIETLEAAQDAVVTDDQIAIYRDTKYPVNAKTMQKVVENYTKTSSSTFEPKQSDMHYWYSPDCGVVVFAEPDALSDKENKLNAQIQSGKDAKGKDLSASTKWIDITSNVNISDNIQELPSTPPAQTCEHEQTEIKNKTITYTGDKVCKDCGTKVENGITLTTKQLTIQGDVNKMTITYVDGWTWNDFINSEYNTFASVTLNYVYYTGTPFLFNPDGSIGSETLTDGPYPGTIVTGDMIIDDSLFYGYTMDMNGYNHLTFTGTHSQHRVTFDVSTGTFSKNCSICDIPLTEDICPHSARQNHSDGSQTCLICDKHFD